MLAVLIAHAITKWSKRPGKDGQERKVRLTLFTSLAAPLEETLALADRYKLPIRFTF